MRDRGAGDDEDVLASIRRLVQAELGALGDPPSRRTEVADALVLTPALRVGGTVETRAEPKPFLHALNREPAEPPVAERPVDRRRRTLEERIAELEAAVDPRHADDWEPDGSEDQRQHTPKAVILSHPNARRRPGAEGPSSDALAARAEALSREGRGQNAPAPDRARGEGPAAPGRVPADRSPADPAQTDRARTDSAKTDRAPADPAGDGARVIGFAHRRRPGAPEGRRPAAAQAPGDTAARNARPTGSDRPAGARPAGDEPQRPAADAAPPAADRTPARAEGRGLSLLEGAIDEALIREIVAEVVREELRGRLGERITRNVRKLVRSEIRRLLATEYRR